jgi:hypothetical protein
MSITVFCPEGHPVTLDEPAPREFACPRCGAVSLTSAGHRPDLRAVPRGMAARPESRRRREEDEEDEEYEEYVESDEMRRKRRARREEAEEEPDEEIERPPLTRKQRQLAMVRLGVLFHILKLWTYLAAMLFGLVTMPLALFAVIVGGGLIARILYQTTFNLSLTLAPLLGIIGSILCAWAPPKSESRGTIMVSLVFDLLAPFFGILQFIMWLGFVVTFDARVERLVEYMYYSRLACTFIAWWLFQLYLRKLCFYMRESLLASECLNVIVHFLIATVIGPALVVVTFVAALFGPCIAAIIFLVTLGYVIFFLVTFPVRQFRLLFMVRTRIYNKFLKSEDEDD